MKKLWNRWTAVLLTLVMVTVLTNGYYSKNGVQAANYGGVEVSKNIVKDGDAKAMQALQDGTYLSDGVSLTNYARYQGVTVSASSERNAASKAVDGAMDSRWESDQGVDPQYLQIDFGNVYALKTILIYWEAASAREYEVQVSADGVEFQTLTEVASNDGKRTDELILSEEIEVRSVKIYCKSRTTTYGDSIYEIGCYGTDGQKKADVR